MEISTELRREFARLRSLMVSPSSVWLLRSDHGERCWMTDKYVMFDVTGSPAVSADHDEGAYRLTANRGLVPTGVAMIDRPRWFSAARQFAWYPARATAWSITDSEAKAMLVYIEIPTPGSEVSARIPLAMNEDVWHAILTAYPDAELWHAGYGGPFRVSVRDRCDLAYVQPIRIPESLQPGAALLAEVTELRTVASQRGIITCESHQKPWRG